MDSVTQQNAALVEQAAAAAGSLEEQTQRLKQLVMAWQTDANAGGAAARAAGAATLKADGKDGGNAGARPAPAAAHNGAAKAAAKPAAGHAGAARADAGTRTAAGGAAVEPKLVHAAAGTASGEAAGSAAAPTVATASTKPAPSAPAPRRFVSSSASAPAAPARDLTLKRPVPFESASTAASDDWETF